MGEVFKTLVKEQAVVWRVPAAVLEADGGSLPATLPEVHAAMVGYKERDAGCKEHEEIDVHYTATTHRMEDRESGKVVCAEA